MASKGKQAAGQTVDDFLAALDHPHKPEILALRQIILAADPTIREEIKWNAPSFRTTESFATFHLRAKAGLQLVFHLGAKVRETAATGIDVADPAGLLKWLAKDRAAVTFTSLDEVRANQAAFTELIRAWIVYTKGLPRNNIDNFPYGHGIPCPYNSLGYSWADP